MNRLFLWNLWRAKITFLHVACASDSRIEGGLKIQHLIQFPAFSSLIQGVADI